MRVIIATSLMVLLTFSSTYAETTDFSEIKTEEVNDLLKTNFEHYVRRAKELSKKQMTKENIAELVEKAMSIIDDMKNLYVDEKLKTQNIVLKYLNGKSFPNLEEHQNNNKYDQKIVKFTIVGYRLFKVLTKEIVTKIIKKSPLEMVPVIKELSVFLQFVSANPNNFGHGVFTEKQNDTITVFATNDAILRIMKVLVYKNLLKQSKIYKMSRIGTHIFNNVENAITNEQIDNCISTLKRNTADDSRIAIYIPGAMLDFSQDVAEQNELQKTVSSYTNELNLANHAKDNSDKQIHRNKALECAKILLGIVPDAQLGASEKVVEFCELLKHKRDELAQTENSDNKKVALKAKRDRANYEQIESFLKCTSKLLDELRNNSKLLELVMNKMPEFVPTMGQEITVFLRMLTMMQGSTDNFDKIIAKIRNFAHQSEDGTYLLSPLLSAALDTLGQSSELNYTQILDNNETIDLEKCKYLAIK